jgi:hypothetical protein
MKRVSLGIVRIIAISSLAAVPAACTVEIADNEAPVTDQPQPATETPAYVSGILVTTHCGVAAFPSSPPGMADPVGAPLREMPERISKALAVGADRPLAETDQARVSPDYVMIAPGAVSEAFLIDNDKQVVATFGGEFPNPFTQLLPSGNLLVNSNSWSGAFVTGGGYRGCMEEFAPDGSLVWRLSINSETYIQHHDAIKIPNGNILAVVWEKVPVELAISQGLHPDNAPENGEFWFDGIVEIDPQTAQIVWEWSIRDHLVQDADPGKMNYGVVADHPERMDINSFQPNRQGQPRDDWTHVNAIDYNAELDQIAISVNHLSEIWIIDHSTTPLEAAGHSGGRWGKGGDFLYRWGNPERYGRGTAEDRMLFAQHDVQWIKPGLPGEGNLLIFNNGSAPDRPYTTVVEIETPMNADGSYRLEEGRPYGPTTLAWEYNPEPPERFFSFFISGAQRLPNGNTLVNQGAGAQVREVTPSGDIVWEYRFENEVEAPHMLFRANRYPPDHPAIVEILRHSQ